MIPQTIWVTTNDPHHQIIYACIKRVIIPVIIKPMTRSIAQDRKLMFWLLFNIRSYNNLQEKSVWYMVWNLYLQHVHSIPMNSISNYTNHHQWPRAFHALIYTTLEWNVKETRYHQKNYIFNIETNIWGCPSLCHISSAMPRIQLLYHNSNYKWGASWIRIWNSTTRHWKYNLQHKSAST